MVAKWVVGIMVILGLSTWFNGVYRILGGDLSNISVRVFEPVCYGFEFVWDDQQPVDLDAKALCAGYLGGSYRKPRIYENRHLLLRPT